MKRPTTLTYALLLALVPLCLGFEQSQKAATSASIPDAGAGGGPVWPDQKSAAPSSAEWRTAPSVAPTRQWGRLAQSCTVKRVREWAHVRCADLVVSAMTQVGGSNTGLSFHLDSALDNGVPKSGVALFPLRKGDRRALLFWTLGPGYDGPLTVVPGVMVQAEWTGDEAVLVLHDALHEPVPTASSLRRRESARLKESTP